MRLYNGLTGIINNGYASVFLLVVYLIVFGSTVFARTPTTRWYKLFPFWSWVKVLTELNKDQLIENLLNFILFIPMGVLLPFIVDRKARLPKAFLSGVLVSFVIEICQLVSMRRSIMGWVASSAVPLEIWCL